MKSFEKEITVDDIKIPSKKQMEKLPLIIVEGGSNPYILWLKEHTEIDRRVPPVYPEFIIKSPENDIMYTIVVAYNHECTAFAARVWLNDELFIKRLTGDYNDEAGDGTCHGFKGHAVVDNAATNKYDEQWIRTMCLAVGCSITAIQAYLLYHKPDIVEQIYTPSEAAKKEPKQKKRRRVVAEPIRIRKTKIKRIRLDSAVDKPPRNINYKKLAWHVRGHYRHVGKDKKLKYIQPFVCNRKDGAKAKRIIYKIDKD